jgi:pimeloyl-ACP methyl ester carboxylesterase
MARSPGARRGRTALRATVLAALPAAVGIAAFEAARRRDRRELAADPEWKALGERLEGRRVEVVSADGTRLHAEVFGPDGAPAMVLAHGWTNTLHVWHYQIRDLAGEFRVIAFDQRGHGQSGAPGPAGASADAIGDDLQAVLDATLAPGERCVVAGHSMGGMTVVSWAGRHPGEVARRVAAAALIDTAMGDVVPQSKLVEGPFRPLAERVVPPLFRAATPLPSISTPVSRRVFRHFIMSPGASAGRVLFCERMTQECPPATRAAFYRGLETLDLYDSVACLDVPTTVIVGELDRLEPPWHARRLAQTLPHLVELVEVPGAGHMVPIEAPDVVTSRLAALARAHLAAPVAAAATGA